MRTKKKRVGRRRKRRLERMKGRRRRNVGEDRRGWGEGRNIAVGGERHEGRRQKAEKAEEKRRECGRVGVGRRWLKVEGEVIYIRKEEEGG